MSGRLMMNGGTLFVHLAWGQEYARISQMKPVVQYQINQCMITNIKLKIGAGVT